MTRRRPNHAPSSTGVAGTTGASGRSLGTDWHGAMRFMGTFDIATLNRGHQAAARGEVGTIAIEPATVSAVVRGRGTVERRVRLGFRRHSPAQVDRVRSVIVDSSRTVAALIGGDLPVATHDVLVAQGCGLVPLAADMSIDCSCGDHSDSCTHAAAVCAALATEIDRDPLVLLTLRGIDRVELLASLRAVGRREPSPRSVIEPSSDRVVGGGRSGRGGGSGRGRGGGSGRGAGLAGRLADPGMPASSALRRKVADLPDLLDVVGHRRGIGQPRLPSHSPPSDLGFDEAGLQRLVRDAATRASAVLEDGDDTGLALDLACDALRRYANGTLGIAELATALECSADDVDSLVHAWRVGGPAGVFVIRTPRRLTETEVMMAERAWGRSGRVRSTGLLFDNDVQVRRAEDGTWVVVESSPEFGWRVRAISNELGDLSPL